MTPDEDTAAAAPPAATDAPVLGAATLVDPAPAIPSADVDPPPPPPPFFLNTLVQSCQADCVLLGFQVQPEHRGQLGVLSISSATKALRL